MYVAKNTSQDVSVRIVRHRRTMSARIRLQKTVEKPPEGIFGGLRPRSFLSGAIF